MTSLYLIGCVFFILLQGFFAGSEIAFISSNILRLRHQQEEDKTAKMVYRLLLKPERFLATTLIGTNLSMVVSSTFATYLLINKGVHNSHIWITCILTPLIVIFAELVPKYIARHYREHLSKKVVGVFKIFENVLYPIVASVEKLSMFVVSVLLGQRQKRSFFVTREEIRSLIAEIHKEGGLEEGEREAIEDIFDFGQTKLKDVCIPLKNIVGIDYTDSLAQIFETVKKNGFTRYLVFKNREIQGYLNVFDLFYRDYSDWQVLVRSITRVGSSQKLYEVFTRLKNRKENIALVMKGKRNIGIVTLEDLIREIINSIAK
ncbi:MAG: DUF21 domain-containing protein [Candidatus Omnitrophica bacterium]|nr:DUF21 domain-containing protein [Candidatus Omnitrophota bacterium]